jgi:protein TonB
VARRKKKMSPILVVSLLAHLGIGAALAMIPQEKLREVVAIAMQEAPEKEAKPEPPKPEPPRPAETQPRAHAPRAPRAAGPQPTAASSAASAAAGFTDLGLTLDSSSADGLAVAVAPPSAEPKSVAEPVAKVIKPKVLSARSPQAAHAGPPPKPRPLGIVRPAYTEEARRARVEGRVRLELEVDEQGVVKNARVLEGLGHGLDEAALAAARNLRFDAARQDGRPVASRFIIAMRFVLGS